MRCRPVRCRRCCPAGVRWPTTPPGPRSRRPGGPRCRQTPGRDSNAILAAVGTADEADDSTPPGLAGLLIGGVELEDLPDPVAALAAITAAGFVVSLELRHSPITELADVVFPVAAQVEKAGAYLNWEGRLRPFAAAMAESGMLDDGRVLDTLGVEMDVDLYTQTPGAAAAEIERLGPWTGSSALPGAAVDGAEHPQHPGLLRRLLNRAASVTDGDGRRAPACCWPPGG